MNRCLVLQNVEPVAKELGVASNSIRNWFATKALPGLPEALAKEHPGPKPKVTPRPTRPALQSPDALSGSVSQGKRAALSMEVEERPDHCPQDCFACPYCQSSRVWKNGRYWVINWLAFLTMRWFSQKRVAIQQMFSGYCWSRYAPRSTSGLLDQRRIWWSSDALSLSKGRRRVEYCYHPTFCCRRIETTNICNHPTDVFCLPTGLDMASEYLGLLDQRYFTSSLSSPSSAHTWRTRSPSVARCIPGSSWLCLDAR